MTDETTTTAAPASPETPATPTAPSNDTTAADKGAGPTTDAGGTIQTAGTDTPAGTDTTTTDGDDKGELQRFREQLAGGDDKLLKQLERYKSVDAISKMVKEARDVASKGKQPLRLSDKPTDDEVKAYRDALGIPPEAKDYPGQFRDDFQPSDGDKLILDDFKSAMHGKNIDPKAAAAALDWYQDFATVQKQELDGNMAKVARETQAALRSEWGGEYDGNLNAAQELMTSHLGAEGFTDMMNLRLQDGSRLQDHIGFVKMMAQLGGDYYGGNAIFNGDIETTAKTVQERIDDLLQLRNSDPEKYKSDKVQGEITKLYAQRDKINARK